MSRADGTVRLTVTVRYDDQTLLTKNLWVEPTRWATMTRREQDDLMAEANHQGIEHVTAECVVR